MYVAYLDTMMREREEAAYAAEHPVESDDLAAELPNYDSDDDEQWYDAREYMNLINLMSKRQQGSYLY